MRNLREKTSGMTAKNLYVGSKRLIYSHKKIIVYCNNVLIKFVYLSSKLNDMIVYILIGALGWILEAVGGALCGKEPRL